MIRPQPGVLAAVHQHRGRDPDGDDPDDQDEGVRASLCQVRAHCEDDPEEAVT